MKLVYFFMELIDAWMYARHYSWKRVTSIHSIRVASYELPNEYVLRKIHVTFQTQNHFEVMAIYHWDQETLQLHAAGYVQEALAGGDGMIPDRMIRPFTDEIFRKIRLQLITEG